MSGEAAAISRSWRVGPRTCTMSIPRSSRGRVLHAPVEWSPDEPSQLSPAELKQYRDGRNAALREIAAELGINLAVVDL